MLGTAARLLTGARVLKPWQPHKEDTSAFWAQHAHTEQCNLAPFKTAIALPSPSWSHCFADRYYNTLSLDVAVHGGFGRWSTSRLGASPSTVTRICSMHLPVTARSFSHNTKCRHKEPNSGLPNAKGSGLGQVFQGSSRPCRCLVSHYANVLVIVDMT